MILLIGFWLKVGGTKTVESIIPTRYKYFTLNTDIHMIRSIINFLVWTLTRGYELMITGLGFVWFFWREILDRDGSIICQ